MLWMTLKVALAVNAAVVTTLKTKNNNEKNKKMFIEIQNMRERALFLF